MSTGHDWPVEVWAELAEARRAEPWHRVFELVRHGKLSRDRAEEWARERDLPKFETRPAADKHDPMAVIDWTLAMVTAWIIWRTPQAVRECMDGYLADCSIWVPCDCWRPSRRGPSRPYHVRGSELQTPATPMPADVMSRTFITKTFGTAFVVEPEQAGRELRDALRKGDLVARAGRQAEAIERHRWSVLSPFDRPHHRGPHDAVYAEDGEAQFSRVTIERDEVLKIWPSAKRDVPKLGRPKGSGDLSSIDKPLAQEAIQRIAAGETRSKVLADVAGRASGEGSAESKMKRIERRMVKLRE